MTRIVTRTSEDALDPGVFATWMAMIGDRIGRRLDDDTLGAYYAELAQRLDTPAFVRGARAVFSRPLFAQWPGWEEFVDAASPTADVLMPPGPEATLARIDAERAAPRPSAAALDAFGTAWREVVPPPEEKPARPPRAARGARLLSAPAPDLTATLAAVLERAGAAPALPPHRWRPVVSGTDETITTDSSEARVRRFAAGEAFSHIYGESIDWRPPRADMARVLADLDAARAAAAEQRARAERAEAREAEGKKREAAQSTWIHSLVAYIGGCGPRPKMLPARDEDIPVVLDMLDSAALAGGRGDVSAAESGGPAESAR